MGHGGDGDRAAGLDVDSSRCASAAKSADIGGWYPCTPEGVLHPASLAKQCVNPRLRISIAESGSFLPRALECRLAPSIKSAHEKVLAAASCHDGRDLDAGVRVEPSPSQPPSPFRTPPFFASHELMLPSCSASDANFRAGVNVTAGLEFFGKQGAKARGFLKLFGTTEVVP